MQLLHLLHRLHAAMELIMEGKWSDLAKAGFRACGIYPLNPRVVYSKHYAVDAQGENVSQALIDYLEVRRAASERETAGRAHRRRV